MAAKNTQTEKDPEVVIESALNRTEEFFQKNGGNLIIALVVVLVVVGGYFGYKYLYAAPRAEKASDMMFVAQQQFAVDSFKLALEGDGNNAGFLDVIEKYGATPAGNLARHYAGICYLRTGDLTQAMEQLRSYKATKGAPNTLVNAQNYGLRGDILVQEGKFQEAVDPYKKAVEAGDNSLTAPCYLKKLGLVYEKIGDYAAAKAAFERIGDEFPASLEARDIEKYIGRVDQQ